MGTRKQIVGTQRMPVGRTAVRLRSRSGGNTVVEDLPLAVGFGSPIELSPRRLRAVPELPGEGAGAPPRPTGGRVIALVTPDGVIRGPGALPLPCDAGPAAPTGRLVDASRPPAPTPTSPLVEPVPLRLTARGRAVLLVGAAAIGLAVVVAAWFGAASSTPPARSVPVAQVVVHDGDTLWSIAGRIAPDRDPWVVVDQLLRVNRLGTPVLVPGQVLRTR